MMGKQYKSIPIGYTEEYVSKLEKEIESLKVENNNLLVMVSNQQKEIESLRQQLAAEKAKTDIDLVNDPAAWDRLDKAIKRGEEWERRAREIWQSGRSGILTTQEVHNMIAEWFEAEGFQSSIEEKDDE